jgi:acyl carrier protein
MADERTLRSSIHDFVVSNFLFDAGDVDDDASLMGEGIIDSTGVLELVLFVEERFGLAVADDEVLPENFDSITRLAAYIARKEAATLATAAR